MNRKAFTLIELMIVVLIIGIISAIAIPKFDNVSTRARAAAIIADARTIVSAAQLYYSDNGEYPQSAPAGVVPAGLDDYLGTDFDFNKYQGVDVAFSFENEQVGESGGGTGENLVTLSVNSDNQTILNAIMDVPPDFLETMSGGQCGGNPK